MKVAVWGRNLEDFYLRSVSQLGADAIDELPIPNEPGKGYFDLKSVLKIKKKIHSYGMEVNRVSCLIFRRITWEMVKGQKRN